MMDSALVTLITGNHGIIQVRHRKPYLQSNANKYDFN